MLGNLPNKDIKRYEWSFGLYGLPVGSGVFETDEPIWYDNGLDTSVIHCLVGDRFLSHNHKYVGYIRVWFTYTDYAEYSSAPMAVDSTPPSVRRGKFIQDSDAACSRDFEFQTTTDSITACWQNVFSDAQSGITKYTVFIGTQPGGDDFVLPQEVGLDNEKTFTKTLELGTKYFITVEAENGVGMITAHSSDGFVVDNEKPVIGVVYTTDKFHDITWSSSTSDLSVSWLGFMDRHSYIRNYMVAVAIFDNARTIVNGGFVDVDIRNTHHFTNLNLQTGNRYVVLVKAVDAAGIESDVAESIPFTIDAMEPTVFTCSSETQIIDDDIIINRTLNWTKADIEFERNTYYRLHITVNGQFSEEEPILKMNKTSQNIPFITTADGSSIGEFNFHPLEDEAYSITLIGDNICQHGGCVVNISLFKCEQKLDVISNGVRLTQIAPHRISVESRVHDTESGIRSLYVGVGTSKGGFQVRPLSVATSLNHLTVDVDLPHGSPLYCTVLAENHAGLRKSFSTDDALILDHTPPRISNPQSIVIYDGPGTNGKYLVTVKLSWEVTDNESKIKTCACAFGTEKGLTNLQEKIDSTGTHLGCSSKSLDVNHGTKVYPSIFCVNKAELENAVYVQPITASFKKPNFTSSSVSFAVNNVKRSDQSHVQTYKSSLHFYWDFFHDISGIRSYSCRITSGQSVISNWTNVGGHNYISYEDLNLVNGNQYTAEVIATNIGGHNSDVITAEIDINEIIPVLTGNVTEIQHTSNPGVMSISWKNVFDLDLTLLPRFIVTIGTMEGYSDVIRSIHTDKYEVEISYPNTVYKLYIVLRCQYVTGTRAVFREEKTL
ncbi:hypothetical protein FSP39_022824 [Pinctada imbricata]|uniref:Fibronectin type-III domain-containing protein n=1 Tax=Pinctada imbricata TaxID=66713 RepID=A0AA88XWY8_PINIB|nr:hypothetical protein FSP39_022824 [Pinctada imbricata]